MTKEQIQALGNLIQYYHSDLLYIKNFQLYKFKKIISSEFLKKYAGTFKSFINEYRVARNINKNKTDILLKLTSEWLEQSEKDNVDLFAKFLKNSGITHDKIMVSLASKILFLNNPWKILPFDNLTKKALNLKENNYTKYLVLAENYKEKNINEIEFCLKSVDYHLTLTEAQFIDYIPDIKNVRINRFLDKILWTIGKNK